MSKEYQIKHIENEIKYCLEYINDNKYNTSKSYSIKQLQLTVKKLGLKLSKLNDDFKKDDIIKFEELGIDKLVVDEAHEYKNLFFHTKINNVGGIAKTEALKSSDMFMKCRYIDEITKGKGIIFATGTPISNSMSELYTMQRYLQFDYLKEKGLHNFDSWVSTFGEIENVMEISPEGKYRTKTRFTKFFNIPELMAMFREIADIQTDDMLDLPKPKTKFYNISLEPTEEQKNILQELVKRAHLVKNNSVEPTVDNMLKITNDGKKLALDQRLINPLLPDDEKSKVNQCVNNVYRAWHKTKENKSTQVIFSYMSTPKNDNSFNIYDDIKNKLINMGVPKEEIAFVHDAKNEVQREELFQKVRNGEIRILLGSTSKLGTGTNIQDKLILIHDLDVPWRPSDLEQRLGRASRQGNENEEVYVYRYITKNTFDAYLWQLIENKQKPISQIMTSKTPLRVIEDVDEVTLSYTEIKAIAMGNPLIKEKLNLEIDITKLKMLQANHNVNIHDLDEKIKNFYPKEIERIEKNINYIKDDLQNLIQEDKKHLDFCGMQINGVNYTDRSEAAEKLLETVKSIKISDEKKVIGKYKNFDIEVYYDKMLNQYNFNLKRKMILNGYLNDNAINNIKRIDKSLDSLNELLTNNMNDLDNTKKQLQIAQVEVLKPFEKEEEMKEKLLKLTEINSILNEEVQ